MEYVGYVGTTSTKLYLKLFILLTVPELPLLDAVLPSTMEGLPSY